MTVIALNDSVTVIFDVTRFFELTVFVLFCCYTVSFCFVKNSVNLHMAAVRKLLSES